MGGGGGGGGGVRRINGHLYVWVRDWGGGGATGKFSVLTTPFGNCCKKSGVLGI